MFFRRCWNLKLDFNSDFKEVIWINKTVCFYKLTNVWIYIIIYFIPNKFNLNTLINQIRIFESTMRSMTTIFRYATLSKLHPLNFLISKWNTRHCNSTVDIHMQFKILQFYQGPKQVDIRLNEDPNFNPGLVFVFLYIMDFQLGWFSFS